MKTPNAAIFLALVIWCFYPPILLAEDERIDAYDPTKIHTYAGAGLKYNDSTNSEYMWETRAIGNIGLSDHDMLLFEAGYGWHQGDQAPSKDSGMTNARLRWFHIYEMDYDVAKGYRGLGLQVDMQLAGSLHPAEKLHLYRQGWPQR